MNGAQVTWLAVGVLGLAALGWAGVATWLLAKSRASGTEAISRAAQEAASLNAKISSLDAQLQQREQALRQATLRAREAQRRADEVTAALEREVRNRDAVLHALRVERQDLASRVRELTRWQTHVDAEAALKRMQDETRRIGQMASSDARILVSHAEFRASQLIDSARATTEELQRKAEATLVAASTRAEELIAERSAAADRELAEARAVGREARAHGAKVIAAAEQGAREIAGEAWDVRTRVHELRQAEAAIKNTIDGYGTKYLVPSYSLMDEVADELAGADVVAKYRSARDRTREIAQSGEAATCTIEDQARREAACRFVLDAFNGKADATLSRARKTDVGTLRQQLLDAFGLVNLHGAAFGEARIARPYLDARLEEVKWACVLQELRVQAKEEQRRIREQMREDAARQREQERQQREAEEAEARGQEIERELAKQREAFEAEKAILSQEAQDKFLGKVAEMQAELEAVRQSAERKKSLAQQTRSGHVYMIANVGAFGEGVFKIGMTRRGDDHWRDRVDELSDASVPFDFNVHAVIKSEDAPALERRLHWHFALYQVNKKNHRKEFFRVPLDRLKQEIHALGIDAQWSLASEIDPTDYLETMEIERRIESDPGERASWLRSQKQRFGLVAGERPAWASLVEGADHALDDVD
jgi:hypothetical protein